MDTSMKTYEKIAAFDLPNYTDIPDIGLFLEQAVKYVNSYMQPLGDISLTGSMVSNYVKKKIIANPVKKQYNREQITYLFFIAAAKTCLSLENLQRLIFMQREYCSCESAYEYFRRELKSALKDVFGISEGGNNSQIPQTARISAGEAAPAVTGDVSVPETGQTSEQELLKKTAVTIAHQVYLAQMLLSREKSAPTASRKTRSAHS